MSVLTKAFNLFGVDAAKQLHLAISLGSHASVVELLDKGADANAKDKYGRSAVYQATFHGEANIFEELVKRGAKVDEVDKDNKTLLMLASTSEAISEEDDRGRAAIARSLIKTHPEMVDAKDKNGWTALMHAAGSGYQLGLDVSYALVTAKARINEENNKGETARMIAIRGGHKWVEDLLVKAEKGQPLTQPKWLTFAK